MEEINTGREVGSQESESYLLIPIALSYTKKKFLYWK